MTKTPETIVMTILNEFCEDWGLDEVTITRDTRLKTDLGFESSDTMQLFAAIQEQMRPLRLVFQDLVIRDGSFVRDLTVGEITDFVSAAQTPAAPQRDDTTSRIEEVS